MSRLLIVLASFLLSSEVKSVPLSCRGLQGEPLDWFALIKLPSLHSPIKTIAQGSSFVWTHPGNKKWINDTRLSILKEAESPLGRTLRPAFTNDSDALRLFYNDELPPHLSYPPEKGHTKGVVYMDASSGFWLIHSAPKFPASSSEYLYPSTALRYGQSFLCISLNTTRSLGNLIIQLLYDDVNLYFPPSSLPNWSSAFPDLKDLLSGKRRAHVTPPYTRVLSLSSLFAREPFISFAKGPRFHDDLYAHLVAPNLRTSLRVETWAHGSGGVLNTTCQGVPYPIYNVDSLLIGSSAFSRMRDHSKWALGGGYVCIGDINRMESQRKRGGGTLCFREPNTYKLFAGLITEIEPCPINNSTG